MNDPFGDCVAFDPKKYFPFSLPDRHDLSNFWEVTKLELKFINLVDVVTHDNNWRQRRHKKLVRLKRRANCSFWLILR